MKPKTLLLFLMLLSASTLPALAQQPTINPFSKSGKQFVYFNTISGPRTIAKVHYDKKGDLVVDTPPMIIDMSVIWMEFYNGRGFKLPPAHHKFYVELKAATKKDGVNITRYNNTTLKIQCVIKLTECLEKEKSNTDELVLYKLFKKYFNKELRFSEYGLGNSELRSIWEIKNSDTLTVITTDRSFNPKISIQIETAENSKIKYLTYIIEYLYDQKKAAEQVEMTMDPDGNVEIHECENFLQTAEHDPIINPEWQIKAFREYFPDLPVNIKPFFSENVLHQIETCGE